MRFMNIYKWSVVLESEFQFSHPDQVLSCCLLVFEAPVALMKSCNDAPLAEESLVSEVLFAGVKFPDVSFVLDSSSGQYDKKIS